MITTPNFIYSDTQDLLFTFICIRKNASTSIGNALYSLKNNLPYNDNSFPKDINGSGIYLYCPVSQIPDFSSTFNFVCLRDPFERVVSFFMHKIVYHPDKNLSDAKEYFAYNPEHARNAGDIEAYFSDFLEFLEQSDLSKCNEHFAYQHVCAALDSIRYDVILDFKRIDWDLIKKAVPRMPDLPTKKMHETGSEYNAKYLETAFGSRVRSIYKKDCEYFDQLGIR